MYLLFIFPTLCAFSVVQSPGSVRHFVARLLQVATLYDMRGLESGFGADKMKQNVAIQGKTNGVVWDFECRYRVEKEVNVCGKRSFD